MWDFIGKIAPKVRQSDPTSWQSGGGGPDPWPCAQRDMFQLHQAGWLFSDLRVTLADKVFEPLYGRQLHTSKDGFTLQRPTAAKLGRTPNDHFDQGSEFLGLQCVQGSVALTDQEETDACFSCWPGSHRYREQMLSMMSPKRAAADFIIQNEAQKQVLLEAGIRNTRVPVRKGDVVLWRSDLLHCGAPPLGACDTFRGVVYICQLPAELTHHSVYADKALAYHRLETSTHWPTKEEWFKLNPKRHSKRRSVAACTFPAAISSCLSCSCCT
jgi:hypothetical protein